MNPSRMARDFPKLYMNRKGAKIVMGNSSLVITRAAQGFWAVNPVSYCLEGTS